MVCFHYKKSVDSSIINYDLRKTNKAKSIIKDTHTSLITKIKWSPHTQHLLATSSTDRTMKIWNMKPKKESNEGSLSSFKNQKMEDWVNNLDWNIHEVGLISLCCNDQLVKAYNIRED
jgi:WD40 repeat protein